MLRSLTTATLLASSLALGIPAAQAAETSTNVQYGDLDLSQPTDAKTLAARLQDAAKEVCINANSETMTTNALQNCVNVAVRSAMSQIETNLDEDVHAKVMNVRTAMQD